MWRLRILAAALVGLLAVGAGMARLAIAAVVIVKVIHEGASFSTLTWALVAIAGLVVFRSILQYYQEIISHHTASIVKVQLRKTPLRPCDGVGTRLFRPSPHR